MFFRQQNNSSANTNEGPTSLSAFAWHVLREICSQQWVLERCLSHPEELCHPDNLLDPLLTHSQAQRLLHMICYPETSSAMDELDQKSVISMILEVSCIRYSKFCFESAVLQGVQCNLLFILI